MQLKAEGEQKIHSKSIKQKQMSYNTRVQYSGTKYLS